MRILKYKGKLVEEIGRYNGQRVILFKYLKEVDKEKCTCGRSIEETLVIAEGCPLWKETFESVETSE